MSQIYLAIAADFTLAEKLLEALENSLRLKSNLLAKSKTSVSAQKPLSNLN